MATLAGPYSAFGAIGAAALDMTAEARAVTLSSDDRTRILTGMLSLPAYSDVRDGLASLRASGFRMVTLTNSRSGPPTDRPCESQRGTLARSVSRAMTPIVYVTGTELGT